MGNENISLMLENNANAHNWAPIIHILQVI